MWILTVLSSSLIKEAVRLLLLTPDQSSYVDDKQLKPFKPKELQNLSSTVYLGKSMEVQLKFGRDWVIVSSNPFQDVQTGVQREDR